MKYTDTQKKLNIIKAACEEHERCASCPLRKMECNPCYMTGEEIDEAVELITAVNPVAKMDAVVQWCYDHTCSTCPLADLGECQPLDMDEDTLDEAYRIITGAADES